MKKITPELLDLDQMRAVTGLDGDPLDDALSHVNRILKRQSELRLTHKDWSQEMRLTVVKFRRLLDAMPKEFRSEMNEYDDDGASLMGDFKMMLSFMELILDIEYAADGRFNSHRDSYIYFLNQIFGKEPWFVNLIAEIFGLNVDAARKAVDRLKGKHPV